MRSKKFNIQEWTKKFNSNINENTLDDYIKGNIEPYDIDPKDFPIKDLINLDKKLDDLQWPSILYEIGWDSDSFPSGIAKFFDSILQKYDLGPGDVSDDHGEIGGKPWTDGETLNFDDPTHAIHCWKGPEGTWFTLISTATGLIAVTKNPKKFAPILEKRYKSYKK